MRCRIASDSPRAPSAVCTTLMPSWALRAATCRPPIWDCRPWLIDRPAASSAARLIRRPEDSFSSEFFMALSVEDRLRYALTAAMLLLIRRLMVFLLDQCHAGPSMVRLSRYRRPGGRLEDSAGRFRRSGRDVAGEPGGPAVGVRGPAGGGGAEQAQRGQPPGGPAGPGARRVGLGGEPPRPGTGQGKGGGGRRRG